MKLRVSIALLGLSAFVLTANGQEKPSPTISSPAPVISEQKLTDADKITRDLISGPVKVIVNLSPPQALGRTDFASKASLDNLRPQIKQLQQDVLTNLPGNDIKERFRFDNIAGFSAEVSAQGLKALQNDPRVLSIEPVHVLKPNLAQGIPLMRGMAYRSSYNGAGLAIAICDSGIDYNHPRLGGGGFPNSKVIGGYDFGDDDSNPIPIGDDAHGTACAGIAAGNLGTAGDYIGGVAHGAKIYGLKVADSAGVILQDAIIAAWDWCVTHKNDNPAYPILVISTSLGSRRFLSNCDSSEIAYAAAANNAVAAGITVLAASGNNGYCDSIGSPACVSSVISVGAVYDAAFGHRYKCVDAASCAPKLAVCSAGYYVDDLTAADKVVSYANVASFLTLLAPSEDCYTTDISGAAGYASGDYTTDFNGTSAACPYAAGAVACLQSAAKAITGSYLTPQQVRACLVSYGDNVTDTKVAITKPRINLERAIQSLRLKFVAATLNGGNGDQRVDPNECSDLKIAIRNDGNSIVSGLSAILTTTTPGIALLQSSSAYPNLAAGATATNTTAFKITTAPSFVCGTPVNLMLTLGHAGGTSSIPFSLTSGGANYMITPSTGAVIVAGTTDTDNHGDDATTTISLPFPYTFYGSTFNSATLSANGNIQFGSAHFADANSCLPFVGFNYAILAHWDDLLTSTNVPGNGIFTSISGSAPNRIFNIEWRANYYYIGASLNFEVRLHEGQERFDLIYGTLNGTGSSATVGVQNSTGFSFTEFECNSGGLSNGLQLTFQRGCNDGGGPCPPPAITSQPQNQTVTAGQDATFAVSASGTAPLRYQWRFKGADISGATSSAYTLTNVQPAHAGNYSVVVSNSAGTAISTNAALIVNFSLTLAATAGGSVSKNPERINYAPNAIVAVTATPNAGFAFSGWSGAASGMNNPLSVTMTTNKSITASFATSATDLILDNTNAEVTFAGSWIESVSVAGYYGSNYRFANTAAGGQWEAEYRPNITTAGDYNVYVRHTEAANRATNAPWTVVYDGGSISRFVNQQNNGGEWLLIAAKRPFAEGTNGYVRISNDAGPTVVIADAVRFVRVGPQDPFTNGLVAYYPFNGNANDASGHGNNGVLHGTDWGFSSDRFGEANSLYLNTTSTPAIELDGAYVTAPRSAQLDFNADFTLSAWINLQSGTPPGFFPQNLISNGSDATNVNLRIITDIVGVGGQDLLEFVWHTAGHGENVTAFLPPIRETWFQATVSRSGGNVYLFKNGLLLATAVMSPVENSPEIRLGRHVNSTYPLIGGIDDVRMYNRALSPEEVLQLYHAEVPATLEIVQQDGSVQLSWPVIFSNHDLLSSTALTGGLWITNTSPRTINGSSLVVTLPATNSQMFYRLKAGE